MEEAAPWPALALADANQGHFTRKMPDLGRSCGMLCLIVIHLVFDPIYSGPPLTPCGVVAAGTRL